MAAITSPNGLDRRPVAAPAGRVRGLANLEPAIGRNHVRARRHPSRLPQPRSRRFRHRTHRTSPGRAGAHSGPRALGDAGVIPSEFVWSYQYIAWLAWVPNLIVAELWIAARRKPRRRKATPTVAPA